jgi:hypothetical protein
LVRSTLDTALAETPSRATGGDVTSIVDVMYTKPTRAALQLVDQRNGLLGETFWAPCRRARRDVPAPRRIRSEGP